MAAEQAPLLLGADGLLGRALAARLEVLHPATVAATRAEIDVTDRFRLEAEIERLRPGVVINCAAVSDPAACEIDPDRARRVNTEGATNAALACAALACRLVHLSTAEVFDGARAAPYAETDAPAPRSVCGRTRLEGETGVAATHADHLIVRTFWVYGAGGPDFVDTLRRRARDEPHLRVAGDQTASPTCADDVAEAVVRLLATGQRGVVHFTNAGLGTRIDLAREILRLIGDDPGRVEPIDPAGIGRLAPAPARVLLDTGLYTRLTGARPRPWTEALADCLVRGGAGRPEGAIR